MKYGEDKKQIKALSSKYDIDMSDGDFNIIYKGRFVSHTYVIGRCRYAVVCDEGVFSKLPFSNKLYMILSELAMTPLEERVEEQKYYVKAFQAYLNIRVTDNHPILHTRYENSTMHTKFTLKEIEKLKHYEDIPLDWNKVELEPVEQERYYGINKKTFCWIIFNNRFTNLVSWGYNVLVSSFYSVGDLQRYSGDSKTIRY